MRRRASVSCGSSSANLLVVFEGFIQAGGSGIEQIARQRALDAAVLRVQIDGFAQHFGRTAVIVKLFVGLANAARVRGLGFLLVTACSFSIAFLVSPTSE